MKRHIIIFLGLLLSATTLLSFGLLTNHDHKPMKDQYENLWRTFKGHLDNDLPESADKDLEAIENMALKDKNQIQLLKVILYKQKVMMETVENDWRQEYYRYALNQFDRLDEVSQAVLHEEIALFLNNYLSENEYQISQNLAIDSNLDEVEMKYWDKQTFKKLIDQHYTEALQPVKALKKADTEDYLTIFEENNSVEHLDYEPTMFEFLFHRIAKHYKEASTADDIDSNWDTGLWWLQSGDFAKADLGDSKNPIIRCLKIYQDLIGFNIDKDEERCLFNDYKRYSFVNDILEEPELYQNAIRSMMKQYAKSDQYPNLANALAQSLIDQYESHSDDSTYFDNYRKALEICEQIIAAYPKKSSACEATMKHIKHASFSIQCNAVQLPNEAIPAILSYRNTNTIDYKLIKVSEKELDQLQKLYRDELLKALDKKKPLTTETITLPVETDYREHRTVIALPALKEGNYYWVSGQVVTLFQVSNLGFLMDKKTDHIDLVTINRKTGHPVSGVTVMAQQTNWDYKKQEYETKTLATLTSDREGKVTLGKEIGKDSFKITLKKGDDLLSPNDRFYIPRESSAPRPFDDLNLFTDRAIYRPGQTVYFKGIVVHHEGDLQTLATNCKETIIFKDANWQEIAKASFTTDEYGSFDGSFVIPTNLLNGMFHLNGSHGSTTIRVEEYKRPTFEINFESIKEQYKLNQDVTVRGSVDALAGFGLDDVQYSYRVVRKTHFPWRCWWWWYPVVEDEQISHGEARTDENGKFAITFNLKPSLKTKPEQQPMFTYEIEVTATSAQGETHSSTHFVRAGYNEVAISTSVSDLVEQSTIKDQTIEVVNMNGQPAKSHISRKIYRFDDEEAIDYFETFNVGQKVDRQVLGDNELATMFPEYSFHNSAYRMQHKTLVYEDQVTVEEKTSFYPGKQALKPGKYYIELKSLDDPYAMTSNEFTIFQENDKQVPVKTMFWDQDLQGSVHPGDVVHYKFGTSANNVKAWIMLMHGNEIRLERWIELSDEIKEVTYTVKEADRGGLTIKTAFVKENAYEIHEESISVPFDNYDLDVKLATLRDKLTPGAEETWTINVKDYKGKPLETALLAGMYDASLDAFASNYWSFRMSPRSRWSNGFFCDGNQWISSTPSAADHYRMVILFDFSLPSDHPFVEVYSYSYGRGGRRFRTLGFPVEDAIMYEEAAMPINAVLEKSESVQIAETAAVENEEGVDADEAHQQSEEAEPALRENFNETAFFFPNLRTDKDGNSTFTFTLPDAITRWKLMMIAYSKDGKTGQYSHSFTASKPVMIMADMPRYMYDTDTLWFVANVINTGEEAVIPKAKLEIFDATTMKPIDLILSDALINMNTLVPGRSQEVRWKVAAKYDLSLLAFRFTAYADSFSDAEQHLLPVLSSEIFMTQTLPITVKAETEKTFDFEAIANPESHERDYSLTLNFSTNPVWYAVQSLPYLANIKTDRPENAFYVFYANSLSAYIADHVPNLMAYIKKWQIETPDALLSQLEKDQDLKAIMLKETPWVLEAKSETEQRSRIANLFELNTLRQQQTETLALLEKKQQYNGGWSWVDGMPESPYITTYILTGFGKLQKMGVWESMSKSDQKKAEEICKKAVRFIESDVAKTYREMKRLGKEWGIGSYTLNELYALSFFPEQNSDRDYAKAKEYFLSRLDKKKEWTEFNFNQRSFAALVLWRLGDKNTAKLIIQSFKECAQKNDEIGMYWPKKYFSFNSHIATHANIMSAFAEIDQDQEMLDQLRVWLLTQKRTNMWENSASTADAIYALLLRGSDWFEEGKNVTLSFSGTPISTEGGVAGTGFIQRHWNATEVTEDMRHLTVDNPTPHLVWGGLFRQYFVPIDEVNADQSGFKIKRELFVETVTDKGKILVPVNKSTLKVGDKLTVKLTFESSQDMSFVFVKDLRAAGFEPLNVISRYHYDDEMCYYQSTTDTDMEFFIDFLPKGVHQLEYSMYVTKEGNLSNGYALIQCQYAPEFTAYSDGMRVKVGDR